MQTQDQTTTMSADEVRQAIRRLEIDVVNYRGKGHEVLDLLVKRDEVEIALAALERGGLDVRPERVRLAFVDGKLDRQARKLLREMGGPSVLAKARRDRQSPSEHWWWFLDQRLADRVKRSLRRTLVTLGLVVIVIFGGLALADRLWGLSPVEKQARTYMMEGERLLMEGELDEALVAYQQALELTPDSPEILIYLGLTYREVGQEQQAEATFAAAREQLGDEVEFYVNLAQAYVIYGDPVRVVEAANAALALDDQNARAYYVRATGYELQNELVLALEDLERVADLTYEVNDTLYVMAKTRYANLLERAAAANR